MKWKNKWNMQLLCREIAIWWWTSLLRLCFLKDVSIFSKPDALSTSTSSDLAVLPRPSWPVLAHIPSALRFKPLRASFPSSKSFKAECVRKAVFGEGSELGRNRWACRLRTGVDAWGVSDLQLSPFLVAPQNIHSSSDEGFFVRRGWWFIVLTNAVRSVRYTGVKPAPLEGDVFANDGFKFNECQCAVQNGENKLKQLATYRQKVTET